MVVKKLELNRRDKNYRFYINEIHAGKNDDIEFTTNNNDVNNNNIILTSSKEFPLKNLDVSNNIVIHNNLVLTSDLVTNDSSLVKIPFTSNNFSFKSNEQLQSILNTNSDTYDASGSGYKISFTPHSNKSKILLDFNLNLKVSEIVNQKISIIVFRDNTQIVSSTIDDEKILQNQNIGTSIVSNLVTKFNLTYLDSPETNEEITYYIKYVITVDGTSSDLSGVGILGYDDGYYNLMMLKELFISPSDYELITNFNGGIFVSLNHNLDISFNTLDICNNLKTDQMIVKQEHIIENFDISNATFINSNDISNNIEISSNIIPINNDSDIGASGLTFKTLYCASGSIYQIDDSGNVSIMSQMNDADGMSTLQFARIDTTYAPAEFFGTGLPFDETKVHRKLEKDSNTNTIITQDNNNVKLSFALLTNTESLTVNDANQVLLYRVFNPDNFDKISYRDWVDLKNAWNKTQPNKIPDDLFNFNRNGDTVLKKLLPEKETDLDMNVNRLEISGNLIINNSDISNFKFLSFDNRIDFSDINIKTLQVTNNIDINDLDITNLTFNSNTNNTFNNLILKNKADISSIDISNTVYTNIIVDTSYLVNDNNAIFHNLTVDTIDVSKTLIIINDLSSNKIIISNGDISINGTNFYSKSIDVSSISNINKITSNTTTINNSFICNNDISINNKLDISNLNILNQVKINSTTDDALNISNNLNTTNIKFTDISGYIYGSSDFIIDPLNHGETASAPGNVTINGNLTVNGDYTIINTNNVIYKDNDLIVLSSTGSLNDMGLTIGDNNQISILYKDNNNSWNFNKKIKVVNDLSSNSINVENLVISNGNFVGDVNNYVDTFNNLWNTSQIKEDSEYIYYNDSSGINIFHNNLTKTDLLNSSLIKLELIQNSDSSSVFIYHGISKETILSFIESPDSNINIDKSTGVISISNILEGSFNKLTLGSQGFSGEIFNFDLNSDENNLTNLNNYVLEKDIIKYVENLNEKENNLTVQNNSTSSNDNYLSHNTFNNIEKINYSLYQNTIIKEKNINDFFSTRTLYSDNIYTFGEVKDKVYLALTNTGIYKSNNLENWKNISIDISSINCGAFNGTLWVVGGETGPNYSCSLYYSFNGEVWYKVKYSKDMIYCVNDLYYDSEKFIAVGKSYNNKAILLISKNGIDWEYKLDNTISYNISNLANTTITNNIKDFGNQVKITKDSKYIIVSDISENRENTQVYIYKINSDYTSNYSNSNDISYTYIQTITCDNDLLSSTYEYASDILCGYNYETNTNILLIKSIPASGDKSNFSIFENNYYDNSFTFIQTITDISFDQNKRDNSGIQLSENGKYILGFDTNTSPDSIKAYRLNKNINDNSYTFINATTTGIIESDTIKNLKIANNGRIFLLKNDKILIYDLMSDGENYYYVNSFTHNVSTDTNSLDITPDGKYFAYNYNNSSVRVYKEKDGSNNDWFELGSITGLSINGNSKLEIWQEQNNKDDIRIIINNDISVNIVNLDNSLNLFSIDNSGTEFSSSYNRLVIGNKSDKNVYVYNLNKEISNTSDISSINSIGYDGNVYKLATDNGIYDTYDLKMLSQSDTNKANNISYDGEKWFSLLKREFVTQTSSIFSYAGGLTEKADITNPTTEPHFGSVVKLSGNNKFMFTTYFYFNSPSSGVIEVFKYAESLNPPFSHHQTIDLTGLTDRFYQGAAASINCDKDATFLILSYYKNSGTDYGFLIFYRNDNDVFIQVDNSPFNLYTSGLGPDIGYRYHQSCIALSDNGKYLIASTYTTNIVILYEVINTGAYIALNKLGEINGANGFGFTCSVSDNGYIIVGSLVSNNNNEGNIYVYKYVSDSNITLLKEFGPWISSTNTGFGRAVSITSDGNYIAFAAVSRSNYGAKVYKKASDDDTIWNQVGSIFGNTTPVTSFGWSHFFMRKISSTLFVLGGNYHSDNNGYVSGAAWLFKYDIIDDTEWSLEKSIYGPTSNYYMAHGMDINDNYIIAGYTGDVWYSTMANFSGGIKVYELSLNETVTTISTPTIEDLIQLSYNTNYLTNGDTSYNLTLPSSVSNVLSIANNRENYVISCVDSSNNILYYSNDLIKWNKVEDITNILGSTCKNVVYNGRQFIASGSKGVAYSNDGIEWFNGNDISNILVNNVISNNVYENQIKQSRNLIIVAGDVSNNEASLAYSHEGFYWLSISGSADIFNYRANAVKCNGDKWVAVGVSNNTIAFSEDGYKWHGLGKYYLNTEGICIESGYDENDNKLWVAGGDGSYNLVYSYDGISWKDASFNNDINMAKINSIKYDGSIWCAGGESDASLSLLYSVNGKEWNKSTTLQNQMEMRIVKSIESDGYMWIAVGSKTKVENSDYIHAYSSDGKDWWFLEENINDLCDNKITKIKYVNNSWIVTTSNTTDVSGLYYSFDGFNWLKGRNLSLNSGLTDIEYCGDIYVETCSNVTSNSSILIDTTFEPYANVSENRNSIYPTYMVTDILSIGKDKTQKTEKIFSKTNGIGYNNNQSKKIMKSRLLATTKTGIYLTTNGLCWEQVESHTSTLNCIGYNNKDLWVYADKNKIKYSNDGCKWDSITTNSTMEHPLAIDYNGSNWLIIDGCDNSILMSNNGILWNTYDITGTDTNEKLKSITYNGTNWLIGSTHDVWYLNDSSLSNLDINQTQIPDISLVNDIHSLGLLNLAITKQGLYQSNDTSGNEWRQINNDISYENINKICYNGIRWVVGGRNILKYSNDISNIVWKDCNMEETNFKINDVKWCGEYFIAGGKYDVKEQFKNKNQDINNGLMIYSYDGINWKKVYNNSIFNEEVLSIAGSEYVKPIVNEKNIIINKMLGIEKLEKTNNIDNINTSLLIKNENI